MQQSLSLFGVVILLSVAVGLASEIDSLPHPKKQHWSDRPPVEMQPFIPCVWSEEQLEQYVPKDYWVLNERTSTLDYAVCRMKARHILMYNNVTIGDVPVNNWMELSTEYIIFRINRLLSHDYHYVTIPKPHQSLEMQISDEVALKCRPGYCTDFHVSATECGGELYGLDYIMSNFYYVHLSMYSAGMLRLRVCNSTIVHGSEWLHLLLTEIALSDVDEYYTHGEFRMDTVVELQSTPWYVFAVIFGALAFAIALLATVLIKCGTRSK